MLPVVLVYAGLALGVAGLLAWSWVALALGAMLAGAGFLWPARDHRAAGRETLLDELVPVWQFGERHRRRVTRNAPNLLAAARAVTAREIAGFRLLTWLRNPPLPGRRRPENILAAPADEPILAVALRSGFYLLGERPEEQVFGIMVVVPRGLRGESERRRFVESLSLADWTKLETPGCVKGVMNFRVVEDRAGRWLTTETRVAASDAASRRRFALYWRLIYPGSSFLRRTWLRAIVRRAGAR